MKQINNKSTKKQSGATMVEYGMLIALVTVVVVATVVILGTEMRDGFQGLADAINTARG